MDIIGKVTADQNEVNREAIEGIRAAQEEERGNDRAGTPFNPEIHTGEKTKEGNWAKKRGRKKGAKKVRPLNIPENQTEVPLGAGTLPGLTPDELEKRRRGYRRCAGAFASILEMGGQLAFGDAGKYQAYPFPGTDKIISERAEIEESAYLVAEEYDLSDLPPVLGLVMAVGYYGMACSNRASQIEEKKTGKPSFMTRAKIWAMEKFYGKSEESNGTPSDTGDDKERQGEPVQAPSDTKLS